jgi:outer membrane protein insertion porin family
MRQLRMLSLERAMKKTNENKLRNFFRTKKFLQEEYRKDKIALIDKFNEKGYRDAIILNDYNVNLSGSG